MYIKVVEVKVKKKSENEWVGRYTALDEKKMLYSKTVEATDYKGCVHKCFESIENNM